MASKPSENENEKRFENWAEPSLLCEERLTDSGGPHQYDINDDDSDNDDDFDDAFIPASNLSENTVQKRNYHGNLQDNKCNDFPLNVKNVYESSRDRNICQECSFVG